MTVSSLKRSTPRMLKPIQPGAKSRGKQCRRQPSADASGDQATLVTPDFLIKNTPLFAELTGEECAIIGRVMQLRSYRANDPLFLQNEPSDALYLLQQGWVRLNSEVAPAEVTTVGASNSVGCTDFFWDVLAR